MDNRQQIVDHFSLRRLCLLIHHDQFGLRLGTKLHEPVKPVPGEPIFMRHDDLAHLSHFNVLKQMVEPLWVMVQPPNVLNRIARISHF